MRLSIVIPSYNSSRYLRQCIDQLADQGLPKGDYEVIIVDDASPDADDDLFRLIESSNPEVRILRQAENRGAGAARNRGLDEARGEYLYFLDADDTLERRALGSLCDKMDADVLDVLFFSASLVYEDDEARATSPQDPDYFRRLTQPGILPGKEMFIHQIRHGDFCAQPCVQVSRTAYLRSCGARFAEGIVNEDNLFVLDSLLGDGRCLMIPDELYGYHLRSGSVTTSLSRGFERFRAHVYLSDLCLERAYAAKKAGELELCEALCDFGRWLVECATLACLSMDETVPDEPLPDCPLASMTQQWLFRRAQDQQRSIAAKDGRIRELEHEVEQMRDSTAWKVGRAATAIPRAAKRRIQDGGNR